MARLIFGGTPADFAVALGESVVIPDSSPSADGRVALIPEGAVTFGVFDAPDGSAVTDLLTAAGVPITVLTTSEQEASLGTIPRFQGPDDWTADLYASVDEVTFYRLAPSTDDLHDRVTVVEGQVTTLGLDDLTDVDTTGAADGDALVFDSGTGDWVPGAAGTGTVATVNSVAPVSGNVTLVPSSIGAATASGLAAVAAIVGARLLDTGAGYPARPAAATWVHYVGATTPTTGVQNGDIWDQPVTA